MRCFGGGRDEYDEAAVEGRLREVVGVQPLPLGQPSEGLAASRRNKEITVNQTKNFLGL